jgi:hypothetical protein
VNILAQNNGGIGLITGVTGDTIYTVYNTVLDPSLSTPSTVGGIPAGTTVSSLSGLTIVQIVDDLLFPTMLPTYTIPSIALGGVYSQTLEVGVTFAPSITLTGTKNDAGPFTQIRLFRNGSILVSDAVMNQTSAGNIAAQFGYTDPNNPNYNYGLLSSPYNDLYVLPSGATSTTTYNGDGNYDSGVAKQDNKGNYDTRLPAVRGSNAPQLSGNSYTTSTATITTQFPYFYGTSATLPTVDLISSAISGGTATKVMSPDASGTLTIPYNVSGLYIWFAYQNLYTTKTKWYVTALNNGNIDNSFITTVTTRVVNSPNSYWSGITYKMHWSVYGTTQTSIQFQS